MMKIKLKIFILIIFISSCFKGFAQVPDSITNQNKNETSVGSDNSTNSGQGNKKGHEQDQSQTIKQVKGARPDMSKSRGARPPYIERQAGSGIPKGIGKPGGAAGIKPGKR